MHSTTELHFTATITRYLPSRSNATSESRGLQILVLTGVGDSLAGRLDGWSYSLKYASRPDCGDSEAARRPWLSSGNGARLQPRSGDRRRNGETPRSGEAARSCETLRGGTLDERGPRLPVLIRNTRTHIYGTRHAITRTDFGGGLSDSDSSGFKVSIAKMLWWWMCCARLANRTEAHCDAACRHAEQRARDDPDGCGIIIFGRESWARCGTMWAWSVIASAAS